jgi:hypothetical protein
LVTYYYYGEIVGDMLGGGSSSGSDALVAEKGSLFDECTEFTSIVFLFNKIRFSRMTDGFVL